jgi:hypothetical protein
MQIDPEVSMEEGGTGIPRKEPNSVRHFLD